jgi:hypothetical protein
MNKASIIDGYGHLWIEGGLISPSTDPGNWGIVEEIVF